MDSIRVFINNMFYGIKETPEVARAKQELLAMMEDKYNELKAVGHSENEAVGQVISEFGNLDDLAESIGLTPHDTASDPSGLPEVFIDDKEVDEYLDRRKRFSRGIGFGVFLAIISSSVLIANSGYYEHVSSIGNESIALLPGLVFQFVTLITAIVLFIINGINSEKFEKYGKQNNILSPQKEREVQAAKDRFNPRFAISVALGVGLILAGAFVIILVSTLWQDNEFYQSLAVSFMLFLLAIAVYLFTSGGIRLDSYNSLLNHGSYTTDRIRAESKTDILAGPYWVLVTAIYLIWSFVTGNWHITWIVWPIAGIIFALIVSIVEAIEKSRSRRS